MTPPTIRGTVPANNAVAVPSGTNIVVTFTEPMDVGSVVVTPVPDIMLGMPTFNSQNDRSFVYADDAPPALHGIHAHRGRSGSGDESTRTRRRHSNSRRPQPPDTTPPTVVSVQSSRRGD